MVSSSLLIRVRINYFISVCHKKEKKRKKMKCRHIIRSSETIFKFFKLLFSSQSIVPISQRNIPTENSMPVIRDQIRVLTKISIKKCSNFHSKMIHFENKIKLIYLLILIKCKGWKLC
jgi:hypothetical protein